METGEAFRILDAAWAIGIRAYDTAEAYGLSAGRLSEWADARNHHSSIEISTKCADHPGQPADVLVGRGNAALSRFRDIPRKTLMTHGFVRADRWPAVLEACSRHEAAAGQSIYTGEEVQAALRLDELRKLQVPGNVLDSRAIDAREKKSPVTLDVRSVYLQGVLLETPEAAEARAPGSGRFVSTIHAEAAAVAADPAPLLIAATLAILRSGDRLVIGVDSVGELDAVRDAFELSSEAVQSFCNRVRTLRDDASAGHFLDPRSWSPQLVR